MPSSTPYTGSSRPTRGPPGPPPPAPSTTATCPSSKSYGGRSLVQGIGGFFRRRWQELLCAPSTLLGYPMFGKARTTVQPREFWSTLATVAVCGGTLTVAVGTGVWYYYYQHRQDPRRRRDSETMESHEKETRAADGGEIDHVTLVPRLIQERALVEERGDPPEPLKECFSGWDTEAEVQREPYTGKCSESSGSASDDGLFNKVKSLFKGVNSKTEDPVQRRNRQLMVMFFVLLSFQVLVTSYIGFRFRFSSGSIDELGGPLSIQKAIFPILAIGSTLMIAKAVVELSPGQSALQDGPIRNATAEMHKKPRKDARHASKTANGGTQQVAQQQPREHKESEKPVREVLDECDALHKNQECEKEEKALRLLLERTNENQELAEIEWRIGRASNARANRMCRQTGGPAKESKSDRESRIAVIREGYTHVVRSLELNEKSCEANKWAAVLLAQYGGSLQDSIKNAYKIREYAKRCVEINPKDAQGYYILGTWAYEVSKVGWWERKLATAIFGEPPSATIQEALEYFHKAESLEAGFWMVNRLKISQCLDSLGRLDEAREWLQKSKELEHTLDEDRWGLHEQTLLEKKLS
eukprot:gb/GECG01010373.1/.p1 GENE.gb/GECG01010373.1/~~gb/GECG01010373.1/.p1  ORF type:complete len:585 (+),score=75.78 gb/GECG01010373.1/:1-1755(+)